MSEQTFEFHYCPRLGCIVTKLDGYGTVTCDKLAEIIAGTQEDTTVTKTQSIGDDGDDPQGQFAHQ